MQSGSGHPNASRRRSSRSAATWTCTSPVRDIEIPVAEVREDAERRVISQLAVLDDDRYEAGLVRLRALDDDATVASQGGSLTLTATKR